MKSIELAYNPTPGEVPNFDLGACAGKGHLMDPAPTNRRAVNRAKALCERCPVRRECFAWMLTLVGSRDDPTGVLGGVTYEERTGRDPQARLCRTCRRVRAWEWFSMTGNSRRSQCKTCVTAAHARAQRTEEAA
jgi:hypothetical protein